MRVRAGRSAAGFLSFASGALALGSVAMIALTSLAPGFDPPGWVRIATMAPLPVALLASLALGVVGLVTHAGRGWGTAGIVTSALAVLVFVIVLCSAG